MGIRHTPANEYVSKEGNPKMGVPFGFPPLKVPSKHTPKGMIVATQCLQDRLVLGQTSLRVDFLVKSNPTKGKNGNHASQATLEHIPFQLAHTFWFSLHQLAALGYPIIEDTRTPEDAFSSKTTTFAA